MMGLVLRVISRGILVFRGLSRLFTALFFAAGHLRGDGRVCTRCRLLLITVRRSLTEEVLFEHRTGIGWTRHTTARHSPKPCLIVPVVDLFQREPNTLVTNVDAASLVRITQLARIGCTARSIR